MSGVAAAGCMDLNQIKALIEAMAASDLTEMEVSENGWTLRMCCRAGRAPSPDGPRLGPEAAPAADADPRDPAGTPADGLEIRAPLAGIVHLAPSPGEPPFVRPGQRVAAGATLALIEAMKLFMAIRAERDGTVEAVLVAAETEVDQGQALMRMV